VRIKYLTLDELNKMCSTYQGFVVSAPERNVRTALLNGSRHQLAGCLN